MPKDVDALFRALEAGVPPVVAFGGDERTFADDALALVRERVDLGAMRDFNWDRVSARERSAAEIVALANTLPVMAERRLVEVRDAEALSSDVDVVARYLERPSPQTVLVLLLAQVDLRDKLIKLLDKAPPATVLLAKLDHPRERDMPRHVARRARKHGLTLDPDAMDAMVLTVGADLALLERAFEKLSLACSAEVTALDVERHVADTRLADAFAWVRAVGAGDRAGASTGLLRLQAAREEPIRLLGLLAWQLRQLVRARALIDAGNQGQVQSTLNLFGDRLSATLTAARRFSLNEHSTRLARLASCDRLLKGSPQPDWLVMARLTEELCAPPRGQAASSARAQKH